MIITIIILVLTNLFSFIVGYSYSKLNKINAINKRFKKYYNEAIAENIGSHVASNMNACVMSADIFIEKLKKQDQEWDTFDKEQFLKILVYMTWIQKENSRFENLFGNDKTGSKYLDTYFKSTKDAVNRFDKMIIEVDQLNKNIGGIENDYIS